MASFSSKITVELMKKTVPQLKEILRARGLPVSGRKAVLVERLLDADITPPPSPPPSPPPPSSSSTIRNPFIAADAITADPTPRASTSGLKTLRIATWNVAGLRALLKGDAGRESLNYLATQEEIDVLLLQETKLQEQHVADVEPELLNVLGDDLQWNAAFACSTARKGYSGVATLWKSSGSCAPLQVDPDDEADKEGRTLVLELPLGGATSLAIANVYTPNSGAELKRLDYRTNTWDAKFRQAISKYPYMTVGGDLNVAVEDIDFFNPHEKRMAKQAGTTPQERQSMRLYYEPPFSMADAFRIKHPDAKGQYSYWSQRARNRPRNRGLRLDYFLLSSPMLSSLVDCQILPELHGSDHCPVVMTLRMDELGS